MLFEYVLQLIILDATKHLDISYSRYIKMPLRKSKTPAMTEEEKKGKEMFFCVYVLKAYKLQF